MRGHRPTYSKPGCREAKPRFIPQEDVSEGGTYVCLALAPLFPEYWHRTVSSFLHISARIPLPCFTISCVGTGWEERPIHAHAGRLWKTIKMTDDYSDINCQISKPLAEQECHRIVFLVMGLFFFVLTAIAMLWLQYSTNTS
jgi:hypothetical protein